MHAPQAQFDVTIAGEINLDLVLDGIDESMPVERELLASAFRITLGSSAAILAHNLAALGSRVGFATLAARDEFSKMALAYLAERNVDLAGVRYSDSATGSGVSVVVNHGAVRHILSYLGTTREMSCGHLDVDYLCASRHFHLSSLFLLKGLHRGLPDIVRIIKKRGLTISLDTNDDPEDSWDGVLDELLPLVDVLLPNQRELLRMTRTEKVDDALAVMSQKVPLTVVKCGPEGAIVQQGGERHIVPPVRVTPVDAIGAGDSFNAGFLIGYVRGLAPRQCAEMGNLTGAISTLKPGGIEAFRDGAFLRECLTDMAPDLTAIGALFRAAPGEIA
jgi:sugar/nucleoside kinase (ribokinase family)